jgi:hypothetical protein
MPASDEPNEPVPTAASSTKPWGATATTTAGVTAALQVVRECGWREQRVRGTGEKGDGVFGWWARVCRVKVRGSVDAPVLNE